MVKVSIGSQREDQNIHSFTTEMRFNTTYKSVSPQNCSQNICVFPMCHEV